MHMLLVLIAAASMNDNQIANVALTANQIDIDRASSPSSTPTTIE